MQLHELKPIYKFKKAKRVGRGGKRGTHSGRGIKGQSARAGRKMKPIIRELIKRYPKLRGYKFKRVNLKPAVVNIEILEKKFKSADVISPKVLLEKRIICRILGRLPKVKILGHGKLTKKLIIEGCQISKSAREEIEKAGGAIKK
ncbi:MAG: 50S ribosomal protein L15 [Candidatus Nealsonbacteria bacterium CG18_big_fil_WC_8_21_14_2_50_37_10]|uniref:Large ribosomal subunit protein uL15 n=1 Tax=Candidatus Nealsonbacteria bacterium CG18_big_fil_WC_8_21_14_2_50_37_10 TaxID=1974717 RepID=A0A2H0FKX0_9BACT|nr:MAG: 50S ribosomal protein L15 [Candidatus Nealsonbacteria bacterium CG18_big_fil_WC_8_21_14_2_50_37_10]